MPQRKLSQEIEFEVVLQRGSDDGLIGLRVSGDEESNNVILSARGLAAHHITAGDRILAVDGRILEGLRVCDVLAEMKHSQSYSFRIRRSLNIPVDLSRLGHPSFDVNEQLEWWNPLGFVPLLSQEECSMLPPMPRPELTNKLRDVLQQLRTFGAVSNDPLSEVPLTSPRSIATLPSKQAALLVDSIQSVVQQLSVVGQLRENAIWVVQV